MRSFGLLKSQQDFESFRASKSFQTSLLKVRIHPSGQNIPRFGFIIPKKLLPKAIHRNLVKRRIKTVLEKFSPLIKPVDVLFYPRPGVLKQTFADLQKDIELIFSKAYLWKS